MLRRTFVLAACALVVMSAQAAIARAAGGSSFVLQPVTAATAVPASTSYFVFTARPGTLIESRVRVVNRGDRVGTVRLYPADATTGQTSGTVFLGRAAARTRTGGWLRLAKNELTLRPGESRVVRFTVRVPERVRPGHHVGGIVAENVELKTRTSSSALQIKLRNLTILAVQVNVPGNRVERLRATGIEAGGQGGHQALLVGLRNDGTVMLKPRLTLTVLDENGTELQKMSSKLDTFLPQTAIDYPVPVRGPALTEGNYRAIVELSHGQAEITRWQAPFAISEEQFEQVFEGAAPTLFPDTRDESRQRAAVPWLAAPAAILLVLLAGFLVLLAGFLVLLRRRRRGAEGTNGAVPQPAPKRPSPAHNAGAPSSPDLPLEHLLFVPSDAGYRLLEREGAPPQIGSEVALPDDARSPQVVSKVGHSPLPEDDRTCAYLQSQ